MASGGAGVYALRLSHALQRAGADSTVLLADGPSVDGAMLLKRVGTPGQRLAARAVRGFIRRIACAPFHTILGTELYAPVQPICAEDIVHLHGLTGWIGIAGLTRLIPCGARVFITAHAVWAFTGGCCLEGGQTCDRFKCGCRGCPVLRRPWKSVAHRELRAKQAFVKRFHIQPIANSTWTAHRMRESALFGSVPEIPIIYPIVDDIYFAEPITDVRLELNIPAERTVISLGARAITDHGKGITDFLCYVAASHELVRGITILVFGDGDISLPRGLDVRVLGPITSASALARIYRTSAVFVSPSTMETFGMTVAEAQAVGTPVVAFDVGGIRDAVHPDWHRFLVPVNDRRGLVASLSRALERPAQHVAHGMLRAWARQRFSAPEVASAQRDVYERLRPLDFSLPSYKYGSRSRPFQI